MLQQAKIPSSFWGDALKLLVQIVNVTPTAVLPNTTPYEAWQKKRPDLSMLQTFGCHAYVHVQKADHDGL